MQLTVDAIVLKERSISEDDRVVTLLGRDTGVITAYAKGARKLRSKLANATELLCYSRFVLFKNRERYIVDNADIEEIFFPIRQDIEKLALASYMAELMSEIAPKGEPAGDSLRLILNALHLLGQGKRAPAFIKAVLELRSVSMAGYMPDLVACSECGCYDSPEMSFVPGTGLLFCADCGRPSGGIVVSGGVLAAMRHIIYSEFPKLFAFTLSEQGLHMLGSVVQSYVLEHIPWRFKTLDFYNALFA